MSAASVSVTERPWGLWLRQVAAVVRLELRRRLLGRRSFGLYLIAMLPTIPLVLRALLAPLQHPTMNVAKSTMIMAVLYQTLVLRVVLFLGTTSTFVNLFRGDELERVLHLYFLAPLRREVLAVAKYVAGLAMCGLLFSGTTLVSFVAVYIPHGTTAVTDHVGALVAYLACTWLAVAGYGAMGLFFGLRFRNAMFPALALWAWEWANPVLPALLKKFSVIYWVQSMFPIHPAEGPLAVLTESASPWVAVPCLALLTAAVITLAARRVRVHEIRYAAD